jgi:hypothetical protein
MTKSCFYLKRISLFCAVVFELKRRIAYFTVRVASLNPLIHSMIHLLRLFANTFASHIPIVHVTLRPPLISSPMYH